MQTFLCGFSAIRGNDTGEAQANAPFYVRQHLASAEASEANAGGGIEFWLGR